MKTSRMLLRLLVLVGCMTLLLDVRYRSFATWAAVCGVYNLTYEVNCPSPCTLQHHTYPRTGDGPYYISNTQFPYCTGYPSDGCTAATEAYANNYPQKDLALCGCGATGQYCEDSDDCCGTDLCQDNTCVICASLGLTCETNADCCNQNCQPSSGGGPLTCCEYSGPCSSPDDCCDGAICYSRQCLEVCSPASASK